LEATLACVLFQRLSLFIKDSRGRGIFPTKALPALKDRAVRVISLPLQWKELVFTQIHGHLYMIGKKALVCMFSGVLPSDFFRVSFVIWKPQSMLQQSVILQQSHCSSELHTLYFYEWV